MQLLHFYLNWFRCNSFLKCVLQPEIAKKSIKPPILMFKVVQGHWIRCQLRASVRLVTNSNLGPISHRYWDTATYWLKIKIFPTPLSFSTLIWGDSLRIYGKASRFLKLSLPGSWLWRFNDHSLHRFWLIHPCYRRTDRQTELQRLRCG